MTLLKEKVKNKGITQQKIADIAGVTDAHINYILNGKRDISYSLAKRIYKKLGYNSPISVILEYYDFRETKDLKEFTEDKQITETVGKIIITHFKNNDLSRNEKGQFLGSVLSVAGALLKRGKPEMFEDFQKEYWKIEEV